MSLSSEPCESVLDLYTKNCATHAARSQVSQIVLTINEVNPGRQLKVDMPNVEKIEQLLSTIYHRGDRESATMVARASTAFMHPATVVAAWRYIMSFPVVSVSVSGFEKSNARWMFDARRPWRVRGLVLSYLELPTPLDTYWRGTSKQNLRTRTNKAKLAGYKVRTVESSEILGVISEVFKAKGQVHEIENDLRKMDLRKSGGPLDDAICVGVFDQCDSPVAFSLGIQTGNVVNTLLSNTSQKGSVRWLCFSGFVEEVSARGGKFILEPPPWAFSGKNRIFAGHLGFSPGRIRSA